MPLRRSASAARAAFLLAALASACTGAPRARPARPAAADACQPAHLAVCERRLAAAPARSLAASYIAARSERDPADLWVRVWRELSPAPVIVTESALSTREHTITVPHLPNPDALSADELLLALAAAAGSPHVIHVHVGAGHVTQLFPSDPLAPFTAGLLPVIRDDAALAHLEADLAIAAATRAALDAAGASHYVDAAREADRLTALIVGRDPFAEPVLRARFALNALGAAGIALDAKDDGASASTLPDAPPPAASDTPYGDYLRVRTAKDDAHEWVVRGAKVLAGIAEDRRDDIAALYTRSKDCAATTRPPPMESPRDLVFAGKLSASLVRDAATEARGSAAGLLTLPVWLARYDALVGFASTHHVAWYVAPTLLLQRGAAFGLSPVGTPGYQRVTALAVAHLAALKQLEEAEPVRYRALSQLALVYSPGALGDPPVRDALLHLTQATVQDKLAAAHDASSVFGGVLTGALAGLSYPPAVQEAYTAALQGAFAAKLHGDLPAQTGWSVAGLYALDAAYRVMTDQSPNLAFASAQITRALEKDPGEPQPALAALATAAARYAQLALEKKLDPTLVKVARFPPERRAARDALRSAVAGLGAAGEAPNNVLDDVTDLADRLIAVVSVALGDAKAAKTTSLRGIKGHASDACTTPASVVLAPGTRRALAKLGDVRQRILSHPRYKRGDGVWVRRVRLLVTLLSDAMDLALKEDKRLAFAIPSTDAEKSVVEALREWDDRVAADAVGGLYALAREYGSADSAQRFLATSGPHLRRVVGGVGALFRGEAGAGLGAQLLDAVAKMGDGKSEGDLGRMLVSYASVFYAGGQHDQGDLALLGTVLLSALTQAPPAIEAVEAAAKGGSRFEWALRLLRETAKTRRDEAPDPAAYADGMRKATDDACQAPDAEGTIAVMQAVHDFSAGKRSEARAALDRALEKADEGGLRVPRMAYRYEEKTATKTFNVTLEVSYGAGVFADANTFQIGVGVRPRGEPGGSLTATLAPTDSAKAGEEAARYYVHTAALATVYHLLEGDADRAAASASRAIAALTSGVRLGSRIVRSEKPASFGVEARALLATSAQLAAEAGMPLLAGDLWTVVRQGFSATMDDKAVGAIFDPIPLGIAGVNDLKPVVARTKKSLHVLAAKLPCTAAKVETGGFEEPACDTYPLALSLRIADVLQKLPRLRHGGSCGAMRALDGFLASADKKRYEPDAFTQAVEELRGNGHLYDAAMLLTRQRRDGHCNPTILASARAMGRSAALGPLLRSDLLATALNCAPAARDAEALSDLVALDADTRRLPDPLRNLKVTLAVAELAVRLDQWTALTKLTEQPEFIERWMSVHPNAAVAALALAHAVPPINGGTLDLDKTRAAYQLLCETFPPGDRAELCGRMKALRATATGTLGERQKLAKELVKKVVDDFITTGPPVPTVPRR